VLRSSAGNSVMSIAVEESAAWSMLAAIKSLKWFCHDSGGELEQIQFLLGHVSVQTTEKYLGCKQRLREAVNDRIGIEAVFS